MKNIIFLPSLSVGNPYKALTSNHIFPGTNISCRFYDKDLTIPELYHPYFLLTGGHHYKNINARTDFGIPNAAIVMGDSGGFQIPSGKIKMTPELPKEILNWLEENADIGINLDIPPRSNDSKIFTKSLSTSYENFKYFNEHQTGKIKLLNVLHGFDYSSYSTWYNKVKDFDFSGWSIGSTRSLYKNILSIVILLQHKEHLKPKIQWLHMLGTSKLLDLLVLMEFQVALDKIGVDMQISTDSSSPSISGAYGRWYHHYSYKNLSFQVIPIPKLGTYEQDKEMPLSTKFDFLAIENKMKVTDIVKYDFNAYSTVIFHNLYITLDAIKGLQSIVKSDISIKEQIFNTDTMKLISIIHDIIADENPIKAFFKYENIIRNYDRSFGDIDVINLDSINEFFEF